MLLCVSAVSLAGTVGLLASTALFFMDGTGGGLLAEQGSLSDWCQLAFCSESLHLLLSDIPDTDTETDTGKELYGAHNDTW